METYSEVISNTAMSSNFINTLYILIFARMKMIQSKMNKLEWSQHFSNYKSMGIFQDAHGQLTPKSSVESGPNSNFEILWLSSFNLPVSI